MSTDTKLRAIQGRVEGRVQGVSFRASLHHQARRCGLAGWVRNMPDGSVEFAAQGDSGSVQQLLDWARQGPPGARVEGLDVSEVDPADNPGDFEIRF